MRISLTLKGEQQKTIIIGEKQEAANYYANRLAVFCCGNFRRKIANKLCKIVFRNKRAGQLFSPSRGLLRGLFGLKWHSVKWHSETIIRKVN